MYNITNLCKGKLAKGGDGYDQLYAYMDVTTGDRKIARRVKYI